MYNKKTEIINLRISKEDKEIIKKRAGFFGMSMSQYILYVSKNPQINILAGGKELANYFYDLNVTLNKLYPLMPVSVRRIHHEISKAVQNLNVYNGGKQNVNSEV